MILTVKVYLRYNGRNDHVPYAFCHNPGTAFETSADPHRL